MRLPLSPVTVALCACLFLTGLAAAAVMPYRAIVGVETLGLTNLQFALITGFGGLATALTSLVLGMISDRTEDRRALVLLVVTVGSVGYGMVWLYPHLWTFALAFAVIVPFGNTLTSQSFSYARSYYNRETPERAAFMMSMLRSLFSRAVNGVLFAAHLAPVPMAGSVHGVLLREGLNALATSALLSLTIAYMQEAIAGRVGTSTSLMDTVTVLATVLASGIFAVMSGPSGYRAIFPVIAGLSLLGAALIWTKGRGGRALA